ncbi:zonular occludens toxin domain-containing protein [Cerasicoccus frondis]|uniref:zonular occludens toxin domain-containing protein n=1 Tax=Cerasicoccus frondis TaxID=490090 RepID=UPI002852739B|nr:zonular occludens toxin domain-containing protein [Cerasicoccus frondis]
MIKLLTGKPRNGKGLRAIKIICDTLLETDNYVVTNLPVRITNLQDYVIAKGRPEINVEKRVIELTNDYLNTVIPDYKESKRLYCLRHFFLHRAPGVVLPLWGEDEEIDWQEHMEHAEWWRPVTFVIDELHKIYPSRNFKLFSQRIEEYFAEHGHFNDTVWLISQNVDQVDKHCRSLPQEFIVVRNYAKEKHSFFRGPRLFRQYTYLQRPTGGPQDKSVHELTFRLDKLQAECYHTSRQGGDADKEEKVKGISVYWVIPVGIIVLLAVLSVPKLFGFLMDKVLGKHSDSTAQVVHPDPAASPSHSGSIEPSTDQIPAESEKPPIRYYRSLSIMNGRACVWLDDGEMITSDDPRLKAIDRYHVVHLTDGTKLFRKPYQSMETGKQSKPLEPMPDIERPEETKPGFSFF